MNLVIVDQVKNLNIAVGTYRARINETNTKIITGIINIALLFNILFFIFSKNVCLIDKSL